MTLLGLHEIAQEIGAEHIVVSSPEGGDFLYRFRAIDCFEFGRHDGLQVPMTLYVTDFLVNLPVWEAVRR